MIRVITKAVSFIPIWNQNRENENPLSLEVTPLYFGDYWQLAAYIEGLQKAITEVKPKDVVSVSDGLLPMFQKYVKIVQGFMIDERAGTVADLMAQPGLIGLVMEIMLKLLSISRPEETIKKKSE